MPGPEGEPRSPTVRSGLEYQEDDLGDTPGPVSLSPSLRGYSDPSVSLYRYLPVCGSLFRIPPEHRFCLCFRSLSLPPSHSFWVSKSPFQGSSVLRTRAPFPTPPP